MKNSARIAAALALAAALCVALPSAASAVLVHGPYGRLFGLFPRRGISARSIPGSFAAQAASTQLTLDNGTLDWNGGPVVHSSAPYLIFWIPPSESPSTLTSTTETLLKTYFEDTAADSGKADDVYAVSRQYTDHTGFADYQQTFDPSSQVIADSFPYPTDSGTKRSECPDISSSYPTCITDSDLQQEIQRLIGADQLPTDGSTGASELPQGAPVYFVVLPSDVNVCASGTECADPKSPNGFCAYHSAFTDGSNDVLYAAIPTLLAADDPKGCQDDTYSAVQEPNGDAGDVVVGYMSHEYNETITDPLLSAWYDDSSGNEEGDNCVFYAKAAADPAGGSSPNAFSPTLGTATDGSAYDQLINGDKYYTQSEWSNGDLNCELRPTGKLTPRFTEPGPNAVGSSLTFDPSSTSSTTAISSETWNWGDGTTSFSTGGLASMAHTYSAPGTYPVTLTMVDGSGNLQTTSQDITVHWRPNASFGFSPSSPLEGTTVKFAASASDPEAGVTIKSYSWNFGDNSTGTGTSPSHTYGKFGSYPVTLTVTNSVGLTTTTTLQITVGGADFIVATAQPATNVPVQFEGASALAPDGWPITYAWNFGDGASAGGVDPRHTYARAGTYRVTLTASNAAGHSVSATGWIVVVRGSQITRISTSGHGGSRTLTISVNGPGTLVVGSHRYTVTRAKKIKVRVNLTGAQQAKLQRAHRLKIVVPIRFIPKVGVASVSRAKLTFTG